MGIRANNAYKLKFLWELMIKNKVFESNQSNEEEALIKKLINHNLLTLLSALTLHL